MGRYKGIVPSRSLKSRGLSSGYDANNDYLDKESVKRGRCFEVSIKAAHSFLEEPFKYLMDVENYIESDFIKFEDYDEFFLQRTYHQINDRFKNRRVLANSEFYLRGGSIPIFFFEQFTFYLSKIHPDDTLPTKEEVFYYWVAKLCYNLFSFAINSIANFFKCDELIIHYTQSIIRKDFGKFISDLRKYYFRRTLSPVTRELLEELREDINNYDLFLPIIADEIDYDDILPEDYMINWIEESEDFFVTQEAPEPLSPEQVEIYRRSVETILEESCAPSEVITPTVFEIVSNISDKSSFDPIHNRKASQTTNVRVNARKNIEHLINLGFLNNKRPVYKRTVVQVSPANARDAWIADLDTRFCNSFFDVIINKIFSKHPWYGITNDDDLDDKIRRISKHHDNFKVMVDIKKAGLTLNHELVKILCEVLTKKYNMDFMIIYERLKNQTVYVDGIPYKTKRGMGLGMLNNLFTVVNMCIARTVSNEAIFFSDDSVIVCHEDISTLDTCKVYSNNVINTYNAFGTPVKASKTICSKSFIFLEEYYIEGRDDLYYDKLLRDTMVCLGVFWSKDIPELKNKVYSTSMNQQLTYELWETMIRVITNELGSEFQKFEQGFMPHFELILPPYLGGYGIYKNPGSDLDYDLVLLDVIPQDEIPYVAKIFRQHEKFLKQINFREKNKIRIDPEIFDIDKLELKDEFKSDILIKTLFDRYAPQSRVKSLEDSLNMLVETNRKTNRARKLKLAQVKFRKNILNKIDISEGLHKLDLINRLLKYHLEEGELNFAIPESAVINNTYRLQSQSEEEGYYENRSVIGIEKREQLIMNSFFTLGLLKNKPRTYTSDFLINQELFFRCIRRYSYKGKILNQEFLEKNYSPEVGYGCEAYCANGKYAFAEYVQRTRKVPRIILSNWFKTNPFLERPSIAGKGNYRFALSFLTDEIGTNNPIIWDKFCKWTDDLSHTQFDLASHGIREVFKKSNQTFDKFFTNYENLIRAIINFSKVKYQWKLLPDFDLSESEEKQLGIETIIHLQEEEFGDEFVNYERLALCEEEYVENEDLKDLDISHVFKEDFDKTYEDDYEDVVNRQRNSTLEEEFDEYEDYQYDDLDFNTSSSDLEGLNTCLEDDFEYEIEQHSDESEEETKQEPDPWSFFD